MQVQDALDDGKAQARAGAGAVVAGIGGAPVALEDVRQMLALDAAAVVADAHLHELAVVLDGQHHGAARRCVAQCVVDQVLQHPLDQGDVGANLGLGMAARRQAEHHAAALRCELVVLDHVLQQLGEAKDFVPRLDAPGVELG